MKRQMALPNLLTAMGLTLGLYIIFKLAVLSPGAISYDDLSLCFLLFIIAAIIDVLDGLVARAMHLESDFGGFFDSMSDAITFGVAPALFVLKIFHDTAPSSANLILLASVTAYAVSSVLRLVRFSTSKVPPELKKVFTGLPVTAAAPAVISLSLVCASVPAASHQYTWVMIAANFLIAYLMISRWLFPSLKAINIKIHSFQFIAALACLFVIGFAVLSHNLAICVCIGTWLYITVSWSLALWRLSQGKRNLAINDAVDTEEDERPL